MNVKICGIISTDNLKNCQMYNPSFIGFINIERSLRFVDVNKIKEMTSTMESSEKAVLVLEPLSANEVIEKTYECGIKNVQLHSLSAGQIAELKHINVIRAIGIDQKIDKDKIAEIEEFSVVCEYLLFDSVVKGQTGGTGRQIPLQTAKKAAEIAKIRNPNIKLFLAGGMNAERINSEGKMIKDVFDYVDVNSGVEDKPGVKNSLKIREFMKKCKVIT